MGSKNQRLHQLATKLQFILYVSYVELVEVVHKRVKTK